jgi:hypothetical protein
MSSEVETENKPIPEGNKMITFNPADCNTERNETEGRNIAITRQKRKREGSNEECDSEEPPRKKICLPTAEEPSLLVKPLIPPNPKATTIKLPEEEEIRAIRYLFISNLCLLSIFIPAMRSFLCAKNLIPPTLKKLDLTILLNILIQNRTKLPVPISRSKLKRCIECRNNLEHLNLPFVSTKWPEFFELWVEICTCMNQNDAAAKLTVIRNNMLDNEFSLSTCFTNFLISENFSFPTSIGLLSVFSSCLITVAARDLRNFVGSSYPVYNTSSLDIYSHLKLVIEETKLNVGSMNLVNNPQNMSAIKGTMDGRNGAAHVNIERFDCSKCIEYLNSLENFLHLICKPTSAGKVKRVRDKLKDAEETGTPITSDIFDLMME